MFAIAASETRLLTTVFFFSKNTTTTSNWHVYFIYFSLSFQYLGKILDLYLHEANHCQMCKIQQLASRSQSFFFIFIYFFLWTNAITVCSSNEIMIEYFQRPKLFNLLKPTSHVMHQQFNIQQLYVLPTLYLCVLYLSENKQWLVALTA